VGTRPEIVKVSSVLHEMNSRGLKFDLVHTGQHYDSNLSDVFFKELDLPTPDLNLKVGSGSQAEQTAMAIIRLERAFCDSSPDLILVQGDTNTVLAAALAATKIGMNVGHIEAGLRSYDRRMPEEHNRRLTDHLSSYLFAPTQYAAATLRKEDCWGTIHVTGNTVIDACLRYGPRATQRSSVLKRVPFERFALVTMHRAENVDNTAILEQFSRILMESPVPVVFPVHPRTLMRFRNAGLEGPLRSSHNICLLEPVGYFDFLTLLMECAFVLTDSGGIQEEATSPNISKKVFVLRNNTERPEAVEAGYAEVLGTFADSVLNRLDQFDSATWRPTQPCPFGTGDAAHKIVDIIEELPARLTRELSP